MATIDNNNTFAFADGGSVAFAAVSPNVRTPMVAIEIDPSNAQPGSLKRNLPVLLIGGYDNTISTTTANVPKQVYSASEVAALCGSGSQLHEMAEAWFANNPLLPVWIAPLADHGSGTQSTFTATCTIPSGSIEAGTLALYINGTLYPVTITAGMTATQAAAAIVAAVSGVYGCPVTAANSSGVVTFTAKMKGVHTTKIDIRLNYLPTDKTPNNLAVAIAAGTAGANNPALTTLITNLANYQFGWYVLGNVDSTSVAALTAELAIRWGPMVQTEGFAIIAVGDTQGNLATYGAALNSQLLTVLGYTNSPSAPWQWAAAAASQISAAAELDPARPFNTLPLVGIKAPPVASRFAQSQANALLFDGITPYTVGGDGTVRIQRAITTYQLDANSNPTTAFLDLNTPLILSVIRADLKVYLQTKYPRFKIADDGTRVAPGQPLVTPKMIKAEIVGRARYWEEQGLVENVDVWSKSLRVVRNSEDPTRVDVFMAPNLVNGLHVIGTLIQYRL